MNQSDLILEFISYNKPCLTNEMYMAVSRKRAFKNGRSGAVISTSWYLKDYKKRMHQELPQIIDSDKLSKFKYAYDTGVYDVEIELINYMYYKKFYEMDASNLIKSLEDCIVEYIGIDDSRTSSCYVKKIPTEVDNGWKVHIIMKLVPRNPLCEGR